LTASSRRTAGTAGEAGGVYKKQINAAVPGGAELPAGPVRLELAFVVGPRRFRNWHEPVEADHRRAATAPGATPSETRAWHPLDGRFTELGMHLTVNPAFRCDVVIGIVAARVCDGVFHRRRCPLGSHRMFAN